MLRPYQEKDLREISQALRDHRRVCYQLPTGGGKTVVAAEAATRFLKRDPARICWFLVHRRELLLQAKKKLLEAGLEVGMIGRGFPAEPWKRMQVASVQTLVKRVKGEKIKHPPNMIIVDEAHHTTANTYKTIVDHYGNAFILGLTATPERHDGTGLDQVFNHLKPGPNVPELIEQGYLSNPDCYARSTEISQVNKVIMGDFDKKEVGRAASKSIGETLNAIQQVAGNKKGIVFCASIAHSESVAHRLTTAGARAEHIDGSTAAPVRDRIMEQFREGKVRWICNHSIISEGFDCPDAQVAVLARPTMSLAIYLQMVGRIMRPGNDKMVLDLAGNIMRHGLPHMEREWSLKGQKREGSGSGLPPTWVCSECFKVNIGNNHVCNACGAVKVKGARAAVTEKEEKLTKVETAKVMKKNAQAGRRHKNALSHCLNNGIHTIPELKKVARVYGYSDSWAFKIRGWLRQQLGIGPNHPNFDS